MRSLLYRNDQLEEKSSPQTRNRKLLSEIPNDDDLIQNDVKSIIKPSLGTRKNLSKMSSEPSKISGAFNNAMGSAKETIGSATGNHSLEAKGAAQKAEGHAETQAAKAQGYADGAKDGIKGGVKDTVGSAIGNQQMQAEGKADKASGDVKKAMNS